MSLILPPHRAQRAHRLARPARVLARPRVNPDVVGPTLEISVPGDYFTDESPIVFGIEFSEPVVGLTAADFTITGTAGGTKTKNLVGSGASYTLEVTGMTTGGTVECDLAAGVCTDAAGNPNEAAPWVEQVTWFTIADVKAMMNQFFDANYTATPWVNQGAGGSGRDMVVGGDATASDGAIVMNTTGYAEGNAVAANAIGAGEHATIILAGTFGFNVRNWAWGTRNSSTNTLAVLGVNVAMRSNGNVRLYASDGTTIVGGTDLSVAAYAGIPIVMTLRLNRTFNSLFLRINGVQLGDAVSTAAITGAFEATSNMNIGGSALPAAGVVRGFAFGKVLLSNQEVAIIEKHFLGT